jgi:hypothetical protein
MVCEKNDWLAVSTDGFAEQNAARPPEHLVKELVQNGMDALTLPPEGEGGTIEVTCAGEPDGRTWVYCSDTGCGIDDMENLRTVFWTSKQDSHLKRGRMGRGFKEMLCLCQHCEVTSKHFTAVFHKTPGGKRLFAVDPTDKDVVGTNICMLMPWNPEETIPAVEAYFETFLPPGGVTLIVNGKTIGHKKPKHQIATSLTTEAFVKGKWVKPTTKTSVELIPTKHGSVGMIYEMGIPVCPVEWESPYHANILQRVPMNPNRDAVMSGFPAKIHRACLPSILGEMSSEEARSAWVGEAAARTSDEAIQKEVLTRAFGKNLARSVPNFGKFNHDADAEEVAGAKILDTKQLSGSFRELARTHIPTSSEIAKAAKDEKRQLAVSPAEAQKRHTALMRKHGKKRVTSVCAFHQWLANLVLAELFPGETPRRCTVHVADFNGTAEGTWSEDFQILTLALDLPRIWATPMHRENFALLIHETAHELAAHHGNSFARAMETTAGAAIKTLFEQRQSLGEWEEKLTA